MGAFILKSREVREVALVNPRLDERPVGAVKANDDGRSHYTTFPKDCPKLFRSRNIDEYRVR